MTSENTGIWAKKAKELDLFLKLTGNIHEELKRADVDNDNLETLKSIEVLMEQRSDIIKRISDMNTDVQGDNILPHEEEKHKRLCEVLLKKIQDIETENKSIMEEISGEYKKRLRTNKQSRDTLGAYAVQMTGAGTSVEGSIINKLK